MGQKKLIRFNEIKTFANVLEYPEDMQGKWQQFFKNDNPVVLELACGKGEYAVGMGRLYPDRNFIGIDLKGNRIWRGAKTAIAENLNNVAFVRSHIDKLQNYFAANEISDIWITFPDPQLRGARMKKRLTHPRFLRLYQSILKSDGTINLKTDSPDLYAFTSTVIDLCGFEVEEKTDDLYASTLSRPELEIKTHYESLDIAQSSRVHYIRFKLNREISEATDLQLKELFQSVT